MATTPLSKLDDYELVNKEQDIRGWKLQDSSGQLLGRIADVIVDTDKERVTAVVLDNHAEYPVRDLEITDHQVVFSGQTTPGIDARGNLRLEVIQERLRIGKRQVEQGGVRVSTTVQDQPVAAQVQLREEQVEVVRRPADRTATASDLAAMHDSTLDVVEKAEVPTVAKQARVVEEVVIKRDIEERQETVRDTVRHTDVEVKEINPPESRPGR